MSLEPIGLVTFIVGLVCLALGYRAVCRTFVFSTLLGAAAAMLIGSANITPGHFFLGFVAFAGLSRHNSIANVLQTLRYPRAGFWLACFVAYGAISALVLPRLFAGMTQIIPLGTTGVPDAGPIVPLGPVSSNFTQSTYIVADLLCFTLILTFASTRSGFDTITNALLGYVVGNTLFAVLDLMTFTTGTQSILEFMRNARYTMHNDASVSGMKRIVGSFTEASAFARSTLSCLGFSGTLWLCGWRPLTTGTLALVSLVLVVLSTSSAGLGGAPIVLLLLYWTALMQSNGRRARVNSVVFVLTGPLLIAIVVLAILNIPAVSSVIGGYIDTVVLSKTTTASGMERASWNAYGMKNFFDTWGIGVGLGTARTSSFIVALLSNVGIVGLVLYLLFAYRVFLVRRGVPRTFPSDVRLAARNACISLLVGDMVVGTVVEQGLLFFIFAAVACAQPEHDPTGLWEVD